jgi:TetR/AcrR family transcriptional regulator, regulator of cefoperazone and chloramphenicol sensitivity
MRTGEPTSPRGADDLTARARIRDAAVVLFADAGYPGTSIREVARAVGVSPGLVQHHFGSKEGLRAACDEHVVELLGDLIVRKLEREAYDASFLATLIESGATVIRYIARGLTEGWPGMAVIFDRAAGDTAAWLSGTWPERFPSDSRTARTHGAVLAAMSLGTFVLHEHVSRWAGVDTLDPAHQHVRHAAATEVILRMAEFLETETGRSMRSALADYERRRSSSGKEDVHE